MTRFIVYVIYTICWLSPPPPPRAVAANAVANEKVHLLAPVELFLFPFIVVVIVFIIIFCCVSMKQSTFNNIYNIIIKIYSRFYRQNAIQYKIVAKQMNYKPWK